MHQQVDPVTQSSRPRHRVTRARLGRLREMSFAEVAYRGHQETAKLIERTRASDRRRVGIFLTPEGDKVLRSVRKRRTAWLVERLERLEPDELEAIEGSIDALEKLLGDE